MFRDLPISWPLHDGSIRTAQSIDGERFYLAEDVARVAGVEDWREATKGPTGTYIGAVDEISYRLPDMTNPDPESKGEYEFLDSHNAVLVLLAGNTEGSAQFREVIAANTTWPRGENRFKPRRHLRQHLTDRELAPPTWTWSQLQPLQHADCLHGYRLNVKEYPEVPLRFVLSDFPGNWSFRDVMGLAGLIDDAEAIAAIRAADGWHGNVLVVDDGARSVLPMIDDVGFFVLMGRGTSDLALKHQHWLYHDLLHHVQGASIYGEEMHFRRNSLPRVMNGIRRQAWDALDKADRRNSENNLSDEHGRPVKDEDLDPVWLGIASRRNDPVAV